jgi:hypothetical protein
MRHARKKDGQNTEAETQEEVIGTQKRRVSIQMDRNRNN